MIRHIFIGTFLQGVPDAIKAQTLADMKAMKRQIPGIVALEVGFSTGWEGPADQIVMTVDMATKEDFDVYMTHPYHRDHIAKLGETYFDTASFVAAQFIFEEDV